LVTAVAALSDGGVGRRRLGPVLSTALAAFAIEVEPDPEERRGDGEGQDERVEPVPELARETGPLPVEAR
jgi:hypothetical protein